MTKLVFDSIGKDGCLYGRGIYSADLWSGMFIVKGKKNFFIPGGQEYIEDENGKVFDIDINWNDYKLEITVLD